MKFKTGQEVAKEIENLKGTFYLQRYHMEGLQYKRLPRWEIFLFLRYKEDTRMVYSYRVDSTLKRIYITEVKGQ